MSNREPPLQLGATAYRMLARVVLLAFLFEGTAGQAEPVMNKMDKISEGEAGYIVGCIAFRTISKDKTCSDLFELKSAAAKDAAASNNKYCVILSQRQ